MLAALSEQRGDIAQHAPPGTARSALRNGRRRPPERLQCGSSVHPGRANCRRIVRIPRTSRARSPSQGCRAECRGDLQCAGWWERVGGFDARACTARPRGGARVALLIVAAPDSGMLRRRRPVSPTRPGFAARLAHSPTAVSTHDGHDDSCYGQSSPPPGPSGVVGDGGPGLPGDHAARPPGRVDLHLRRRVQRHHAGHQQLGAPGDGRQRLPQRRHGLLRRQPGHDLGLGRLPEPDACARWRRSRARTGATASPRATKRAWCRRTDSSTRPTAPSR